MMSGGFSAIGDMIELASPPKNGITSLVFGNDANISNTQCRLMASSWDKVSLGYNISQNGETNVKMTIACIFV